MLEKTTNNAMQQSRCKVYSKHGGENDVRVRGTRWKTSTLKRYREHSCLEEKMHKGKL